MYAWIWRRLPGPWWTRAITSVLAIVVVEIFVIFAIAGLSPVRFCTRAAPWLVAERACGTWLTA